MSDIMEHVMAMQDTVKQLLALASGLLTKQPEDADPLLQSRDELLERLSELRWQALTQASPQESNWLMFRFGEGEPDTPLRKGCLELRQMCDRALELDKAVTQRWEGFKQELVGAMHKNEKNRRVMDFINIANGGDNRDNFRGNALDETT